MANEDVDVRVDLERDRRTSIPEVIYGASKSREQIARIAQELFGASGFALATRVAPEDGFALETTLPSARYFERARILQCGALPRTTHRIAVACAGTSDIPVAEEAARTLDAFGHDVVERYDVGVAGIHRTLAARDALDACRAVIVVAGMEGALPSVIAGLVHPPVIAVPTSVGYGASFNGLAALLAMLNSCAPGVSVVNIDNGFGAACVAHKIVTSSV
ncbi:MAG: nickel pincer cofactor biosynthesis protein LarB [Candidatus Eremiobacteraeota bacterium]|nr:nickel pincer cofactor biosynthesis protein LarB [Candidatus Eremiobacteraeota bacterium]